VYVGADLQDLYGVNAATITDAGQLQDAYFQGGSARDLMATLARQPDAALFSAETVLDFQLHPGDQLNLRIRDAASGRLIDVPFHYVGVATEFPTAPSDSFVVANASYLAARTGNPSPDVLLVQPTGTTPHALAARLQRALGTRAKVSDIEESRRVIGSSLTAVDLGGLTKIELGYSLVIAAAATGLVLALGFAERRRSLAIISVLGARPGQLAAFTRAEAAALGVIGGALGAAAGWELARVLVKVLTGVFDPAPSALAVPWGYLSAVAALTIAGLLASAHLAARMARSPKASALRDL
jgi:putative ABC transport system permease protein